MRIAGSKATRAQVELLDGARHRDPFAFLGRHATKRGVILRCFVPRAAAVWLEPGKSPLARLPGTDLFTIEFHDAAEFDAATPTGYPRLGWETESGQQVVRHDPYSFPSALDRDAMHAFNAGKHFKAQQLLGARPFSLDGIAGTLFAVWAPNAERVSVVGDFNDWDGRIHPMRFHAVEGIWELFVPDLNDGAYKFEVRTVPGGNVQLKSDPFARSCEMRPATASLIPLEQKYRWHDAAWLQGRRKSQPLESPMSIYEVHLGSWRRHADGSFPGYRELAKEICAHVRELGFTHIELLPVMEHPLDESWGYQCTGYFAPTSRHGSPDDFRAFVDHCHRQGIGVLLDWVPAHFPRDAHGLAHFDGAALYEYHDAWKAEQRDWGTLVFNFERLEVRSFLISSALYWLNEFHIDGLRVDAVASMLYLNFSRQAEQWVPNRFGGHHNLEAIEFIRALNVAVREQCPGCLMIAEESSDWHGVTHPVEKGGLGFHFKWNMGWMHDTLNYLAKDPIHRRHHHGWLTFGPVYAFNENFVLPLSHDEVVHLKKSLFGRMPGDEWQRYANLRLLYCYQWLFPGKELLFMGGENAQPGEWDSAASLPRPEIDQAQPRNISHLLRTLNQMQAEYPALSRWDCDARGFEWLDGEDEEHSVIAFLRHGPGSSLVVVFNFTPEPRRGYRIPVPGVHAYREIFNSDAAEFGGSGMHNVNEPGREELAVMAQPHRGKAHSLLLDLPPLAAVVLQESPELPAVAKV